MEYRVVEIETHVPAEQAREIEIARFDSAYHAADYMTTSWRRGDKRAGRLHLKDGDGSILLSPYDLVEIATGSWA